MKEVTLHSPRNGNDSVPTLEEQAPRRVDKGEWSTHKSAKDHTTQDDLARSVAQIVRETKERGDRKLG